MDEEKTPTRCEIPDSDKWDLSHLFAEVSKWQEDFGWVERTYRRIAQWKGKIGQSAETLAEVLEFEKELDLKIERLYHFASLQLAEDSSNNEHLARIGQLQNLLTKIGEALPFAGAQGAGELFARCGPGALANQVTQDPKNASTRVERTRRTPPRARRGCNERLRRRLFAVD